MSRCGCCAEVGGGVVYMQRVAHYDPADVTNRNMRCVKVGLLLCWGRGWGGGRVGVKGVCMQRVLNCDPAAATRKVRYVKVGPMLC
jgi:hypothetical protein